MIKGNIKGNNSSKYVCLIFLYACMFCLVLFCVLTDVVDLSRVKFFEECSNVFLLMVS